MKIIQRDIEHEVKEHSGRYIKSLLSDRIKSSTMVYDGKDGGTIENVRLVPFLEL